MGICLKTTAPRDDPGTMQINQNARSSWARFDIAKLFIVVLAVTALLLTFGLSSPASHESAASNPAATKAAQPTKAQKASSRPAANPATTQSPNDVVGAPPGSITPPSRITANCTKDVSWDLQHWLAKLPAGSVVYSPAGACYRIDEGINLLFPYKLTVDGGEFLMTTPGTPHRAGFDVIGGSQITFENLEIVGPNVNVQWVRTRAFQSGITLQGTKDSTIFHVRIQDVYGNSISLGPLRGSADHMSGVILRPVENLTVDHVYIDGAGRQGISPVSVDGAL